MDIEDISFENGKSLPWTREIIINERYINFVSTSDYFNPRKNINNLSAVRHSQTNTYNLKRLFTSEYSNEILPVNTRYHSKDYNGDHIIVVEEPPAIRTIKLNLPLLTEAEQLQSSGKLEKYGFKEFLENSPIPPYNVTLSFPYIIYLLKMGPGGLKYLKVYFRLHPLSSIDDYLIIPFLPNMSNSEVCTGDIKLDEDPSKLTLSSMVDTYITAWWEYEFNSDLSGNYDLYTKDGPPELNGYLTWAYFTQYDPMFIFGINWILYENTLRDFISKLYTSTPENDSSETFNKLTKTLTNSYETTSIVKFSYTDYLVVGNNNIISVGDEVEIDGKLLYLYSIAVNRVNGQIDYIEFSDEADKITKFTYNDEMCKKIDDYIESKKENLKYILEDGTELKQNQIVAVNLYNNTSNVTYKEFKGMRKTRDGVVEIKLGPSYYIKDLIEIKPIDLSDIEINGVKLVVNEKYLLKQISTSSNYNPVYKTHIYEFKKIIVGDGKIKVKFLYIDAYGDPNTNSYNIDSFKTNYDLIPVNTLHRPKIMRVGKKLYTQDVTSDRGIFTKIDKSIYKLDRHVRFNYSNFIEKIGDENNIEKLDIPGLDGNINLEIGDEVVIANWENPYEMTIIQKIKSFDLDLDSGYLNVTVIGSDDVTRSYQYIELSSGSIDVGLIRKVTRTYKNLAIGMKMKAKEAGIPMFPKSGVNQIVAFIVDTHTEYPLILCSNLCTLWADPETIGKFDFIPLYSSRYNRLKITPVNVKKIKKQPGDFVTKPNESTLDELQVYVRGGKNTSFRTIVISPNFDGFSERYGENLSSYKFDGIITPRVQKNRFDSTRRTAGLPSVFGSYIHLGEDNSNVIRYAVFNPEFIDPSIETSIEAEESINNNDDVELQEETSETINNESDEEIIDEEIVDEDNDDLF